MEYKVTSVNITLRQIPTNIEDFTIELTAILKKLEEQNEDIEVYIDIVGFNRDFLDRLKGKLMDNYYVNNTFTNLVISRKTLTNIT